MRNTVQFLGVLLAALVFQGCPPSPSKEDAGALAPDAAVGVTDAGNGGDASGMDAGPADAAQDPDAAVPDAAGGTDAAVAPDAASGPGDAGEPPDAAGGAGDAGNSAILPGQWCNLVAQTRCHAEQNCAVPGGSVGMLAECIGGAAAWCGNGLLETMAGLGWLALDQARARECLASWDGLDCTVFNRAGRDERAVGGCAQALVPQQHPGEPCVQGVECQTGRCTLLDSCPGTCAPWAGADAGCDQGAACAPGEVCQDGTCQHLPTDPGAPCPLGACAFPLVCQGESTPAVCTSFGLTGEPCGPDQAVCFPDLLCQRANPQEQGTCTPFRVPGETCFGTADCRDPDGGAPVCAGGTCAVAPGPGQPCQEFQCSGGFCDTTALPPTCRAFAGVGEPCTADWRCGPQLRCAGAQGCQPRLAPGADCSAAPEGCGLGATCLAGHCVVAGLPACLPTN